MEPHYKKKQCLVFLTRPIKAHKCSEKMLLCARNAIQSVNNCSKVIPSAASRSAKLLPTTSIPEVNGRFAAPALADDSGWL